ncbi:MAG: hypothetical protein LBP59_07960 [Planctomycetaceae bacterium]|nr:hypothetical protein [Planctomycetaceae bacterium]
MLSLAGQYLLLQKIVCWIADVSPAFRIANISPGVPSDSQAERLHPRIAGVSPACGCTQPPMNEV